MFADLQRQIDDLAARLDTLTRLAPHAHTLTKLNGAPPDKQGPAPNNVQEGSDGQP